MKAEYYENLEGVANAIHRCYYEAQYSETPESPEERKRRAADCRALFLQFLNKWFLVICEEVASDDVDVPLFEVFEKLNRDVDEALHKEFQKMMAEKFKNLIE